MKQKINWKNVYNYFQGNIRYYLYNNYKFLISLHIREQIDVRINSMNLQCYNQGSCIECGCATTMLQMANITCEGNCYPKMLTKKDWRYFKLRKLMVINKVLWKLKYGKFQKVGNGLD